MKTKPSRTPASKKPPVRPARILNPSTRYAKVVEMVPLVLRLKEILVPIDFSKTSMEALHYAVPLAKQFDAKITLLHVMDFPIYAPEIGYGIVEDADARRGVQERLAALARRALPPGLEAETLVERGASFDSITSVARERAVDLIVITTHGYTGFKHVLMGSTAERVVRHAPCPVLVVR